MKTYINLILASILLASSFACSDDDKNIFNDLKTDTGFVRFSENPPSNIGVSSISELKYTFKLIDPNESTASYDLRIYADISGKRTDTLPVTTITSFPKILSYSANDLAGFLGIEAADIGFGDNFFFTAEVTSKNGVKYSGTESAEFDDLDDLDPKTFEILGGGLTSTLLDESGYRQAFEFNFIILCPDAITVDDFIGSWEVTKDDFGVLVDDFDGSFEIIAGPEKNQVTMLNPFGHSNPDTGEAYNVILDLDPPNGEIAVESQSAWHCANVGCTFGEGKIEGDGLSFLCVDLIKLNLEYTVAAGSFGSAPIDLKKL